MAGDARWDPRQGPGLYTELEEVGKGSRQCLGGRRVSQVKGNRGAPRLLSRFSPETQNTSGMWCQPPACRFLLFKWMWIPARVEIQMRD